MISALAAQLHKSQNLFSEKAQTFFFFFVAVTISLSISHFFNNKERIRQRKVNNYII